MTVAVLALTMTIRARTPAVDLATKLLHKGLPELLWGSSWWKRGGAFDTIVDKRVTTFRCSGSQSISEQVYPSQECVQPCRLLFSYTYKYHLIKTCKEFRIKRVLLVSTIILPSVISGRSDHSSAGTSKIVHTNNDIGANKQQIVL